MTDDVQIVSHRYTVEATQFALIKLDLRDWVEEHVRRQVREFCAQNNRTMLGPILIDWTCRAEVRTSPAPEQTP